MNTRIKRVEVEFGIGTTRDEAFNELQEIYRNLKATNPDLEIVVGNFNKYVFTSDMTLDDVYRMMFDQTKEQYDEERRQEEENRRREEEEYRANIPMMHDEYMKQARECEGFNHKLLDEFSNTINNALTSIYRDMLLIAMFEIINILYEYKDEPDKAITVAINKLNEQGHSNNSAAYTGRLVQRYSVELGDKFFYTLYPDMERKDKAFNINPTC